MTPDTFHTMEAFADPIIAIDPLAEFSPGMLYADFFEVQLADGVVQQIEDPDVVAVTEPPVAALATVGIVGVVTMRRRSRGRKGEHAPTV